MSLLRKNILPLGSIKYIGDVLSSLNCIIPPSIFLQTFLKHLMYNLDEGKKFTPMVNSVYVTTTNLNNIFNNKIHFCIIKGGLYK